MTRSSSTATRKSLLSSAHLPSMPRYRINLSLPSMEMLVLPPPPMSTGTRSGSRWFRAATTLSREVIPVTLIPAPHSVNSDRGGRHNGEREGARLARCEAVKGSLNEQKHLAQRRRGRKKNKPLAFPRSLRLGVSARDCFFQSFKAHRMPALFPRDRLSLHGRTQTVGS